MGHSKTCFGDHQSTLPVGFQIVQKERRMLQLKGLLRGDATFDARINKKIHKLHKELCELDPSRKMPDCWTLISVVKFVRRLKSKVAESRSYLCSIMCCRSSAGQDEIPCDLDAQATLIDLDDDPADLTGVINLDSTVDLDDAPGVDL